jgi:hypothetical protein
MLRVVCGSKELTIMSAFRRRQTGRSSLTVSIISILSALITLQAAPLAALIVVAGAGVMGFLFSSLTIEAREGRLNWWFGFRFWGQEIAIADIAAVSVSRTPLWYGWGIRKIARGWLYNVSGREAVELTLKDGRRILLGTDRPLQLAAVLGAAV